MSYLELARHHGREKSAKRVRKGAESPTGRPGEGVFSLPSLFSHAGPPAAPQADWHMRMACAALAVAPELAKDPAEVGLHGEPLP